MIVSELQHESDQWCIVVMSGQLYQVLGRMVCRMAVLIPTTPMRYTIGQRTGPTMRMDRLR